MPTAKTAALLDRMGQRLHLTDGGLETDLTFLRGHDLPYFASFPLLTSPDGRETLRQYFTGFLDEAEALGLGFVLDTPTWRSSAGWGQTMGWTSEAIDQINRDAVAFVAGLRDARGEAGRTIVLNGVVGPHGDAYAPQSVLSAEAAQAYHQRQVKVMAEAGVDMVTAVTISSVGEAVGIAQAARAVDVPVALSFTVETDGRLVSGMTLAEAVQETDAATGGYAAWFGINCAHPDHFGPVLSGPQSAALVRRIGAVRANASRLSHAELDEAAELDAGDPQELAEQYRRLQPLLPALRVMGGCCGTDLRHVAAIGQRCAHHAA